MENEIEQSKVEQKKIEPNKIERDKIELRGLHIYMFLSTICLLICIFWLGHYAKTESQVNSVVELLKDYTNKNITDDELSRKIEIMYFKEEHFVEQLGIQSDWFIGYVTIIFALFGIIGFSAYSSQFNQLRKDTDNFVKTIQDYIVERDGIMTDYQVNLTAQVQSLNNKLDFKFKELKLLFNRNASDGLQTLAATFTEQRQQGLAFLYTLKGIAADLDSLSVITDNQERLDLISKNERTLHGMLLSSKSSIGIHKDDFADNLSYADNLKLLNELLDISDQKMRDTVRDTMNLFDDMQRHKYELDIKRVKEGPV